MFKEGQENFDSNSAELQENNLQFSLEEIYNLLPQQEEVVSRDRRVNRRDFIKIGGAILGAVAVSGVLGKGESAKGEEIQPSKSIEKKEGEVMSEREKFIKNIMEGFYNRRQDVSVIDFGKEGEAVSFNVRGVSKLIGSSAPRSVEKMANLEVGDPDDIFIVKEDEMEKVNRVLSPLAEQARLVQDSVKQKVMDLGVPISEEKAKKMTGEFLYNIRGKEIKDGQGTTCYWVGKEKLKELWEYVDGQAKQLQDSQRSVHDYFIGHNSQSQFYVDQETTLAELKDMHATKVSRDIVGLPDKEGHRWYGMKKASKKEEDSRYFILKSLVKTQK